MTMRWPLSQQQEMQDHFAAMETGGTVSTDSLSLPSPAITAKDYAFKLSVVGIKYSLWPNRKCTQRREATTAKPARLQEKEKCSRQCRKDCFLCVFVLFCFVFWGSGERGTWPISLCSFGARTTLATFSHISWSLNLY